MWENHHVFRGQNSWHRKTGSINNFRTHSNYSTSLNLSPNSHKTVIITKATQLTLGIMKINRKRIFSTKGNSISNCHKTHFIKDPSFLFYNIYKNLSSAAGTAPRVVTSASGKATWLRLLLQAWPGAGWKLGSMCCLSAACSPPSLLPFWLGWAAQESATGKRPSGELEKDKQRTDPSWQKASLNQSWVQPE